MIGFTTYDNNTSSIDLKPLIPIEFQTGFQNISLPVAPVIPSSSDDTYNDYKNLFSLNHLQVMSTLNFGTSGVQAQTKANHPLWKELDKKTNSKIPSAQGASSSFQASASDVDKQLEEFFNLAKSVNSTIKKSVVSQLSVNIQNMYSDNKKIYKTLDKLLLVLLKLNFQKKEEEERIEYNKRKRDDKKVLRRLTILPDTRRDLF